MPVGTLAKRLRIRPGARESRQTRLFARLFLIKQRMSLRERTHPGLGIIEPCLPSPAKVPPSGPGWIHEIKLDGFRIQRPPMSAYDPKRTSALLRPITSCVADTAAHPPTAPTRSKRRLPRNRKHAWRRPPSALKPNLAQFDVLLAHALVARPSIGPFDLDQLGKLLTRSGADMIPLRLSRLSFGMVRHLADFLI